MAETAYESARKALDDEANHQLLLYVQRSGAGERLGPSDPLWFLIGAIVSVCTNMLLRYDKKLDAIEQRISESAEGVKAGNKLADFAKKLQGSVDTLKSTVEEDTQTRKIFMGQSRFERIATWAAFGTIFAVSLFLGYYKGGNDRAASDLCPHIETLAHDARTQHNNLARNFIIRDANAYSCKLP